MVCNVIEECRCYSYTGEKNSFVVRGKDHMFYHAQLIAVRVVALTMGLDNHLGS